MSSFTTTYNFPLKALNCSLITFLYQDPCKLPDWTNGATGIECLPDDFKDCKNLVDFGERYCPLFNCSGYVHPGSKKEREDVTQDSPSRPSPPSLPRLPSLPKRPAGRTKWRATATSLRKSGHFTGLGGPARRRYSPRWEEVNSKSVANRKGNGGRSGLSKKKKSGRKRKSRGRDRDRQNVQTIVKTVAHSQTSAIGPVTKIKTVSPTNTFIEIKKVATATATEIGSTQFKTVATVPEIRLAQNKTTASRLIGSPASDTHRIRPAGIKTTSTVAEYPSLDTGVIGPAQNKTVVSQLIGSPSTDTRRISPTSIRTAATVPESPSSNTLEIRLAQNKTTVSKLIGSPSSDTRGIRPAGIKTTSTVTEYPSSDARDIGPAQRNLTKSVSGKKVAGVYESTTSGSFSSESESVTAVTEPSRPLSSSSSTSDKINPIPTLSISPSFKQIETVPDPSFEQIEVTTIVPISHGEVGQTLSPSFGVIEVDTDTRESVGASKIDPSFDKIRLSSSVVEPISLSPSVSFSKIKTPATLSESIIPPSSVEIRPTPTISSGETGATLSSTVTTTPESVNPAPSSGDKITTSLALSPSGSFTKSNEALFTNYSTASISISRPVNSVVNLTVGSEVENKFKASSAQSSVTDQKILAVRNETLFTTDILISKPPTASVEFVIRPVTKFGNTSQPSALARQAGSEMFAKKLLALGLVAMSGHFGNSEDPFVCPDGRKCFTERIFQENCKTYLVVEALRSINAMSMCSCRMSLCASKSDVTDIGLERRGSRSIRTS